jgi:dynactin complex subunit
MQLGSPLTLELNAKQTPKKDGNLNGCHYFACLYMAGIFSPQKKSTAVNFQHQRVNAYVL